MKVDLFDDRNKSSNGFFYYVSWFFVICGMCVFPILMAFMKEYYTLSKPASEIGTLFMFMCFPMLILKLIDKANEDDEMVADK